MLYGPAERRHRKVSQYDITNLAVQLFAVQLREEKEATSSSHLDQGAFDGHRSTTGCSHLDGDQLHFAVAAQHVKLPYYIAEQHQALGC